MADSGASASGRTFVQQMLLLFAASVFLYAFLHAVVASPAPSTAAGCTAEPSWPCFASIDPLGDLQIESGSDARWYVGRATLREVSREAEANARAMDELRQRVGLRVGAQIAPLLVDRSPADRLMRQVASGRHAEAIRTFDEIVASLSTITLNGSAIELVGIGSDLDRLADLRRSQQALAERLSPPLSRIFFWKSPSLSVVEVLFWAVFGVLTQLLVDATERIRRGRFRRRERLGDLAELLYGPVLAVALVVAMVNGILAPDSVELRIWILPLIGFVSGFGSRGLARAIDRSLGRLLGGAEPIPADAPSPEIAKRMELLDKLMSAYRPSDLLQMRHQLRELAYEIVEAEVAAGDES